MTDDFPKSEDHVLDTNRDRLGTVKESNRSIKHAKILFNNETEEWIPFRHLRRLNGIEWIYEKAVRQQRDSI